MPREKGYNQLNIKLVTEEEVELCHQIKVRALMAHKSMREFVMDLFREENKKKIVL